MAIVSNLVASRLLEILRSPTGGVSPALGSLSEAEGVRIEATYHVIGQNVAAEIADKSTTARYPAMYVYCEKLSNQMREKFRTFSGKARMVVETRISGDRLEQIEERTSLLVDAVTSVLDSSRGDWGNGMLFNGGYEVIYGPVKPGGRNFLQSTKVIFDVEISTSR